MSFKRIAIISACCMGGLWACQDSGSPTSPLALTDRALFSKSTSNQSSRREDTVLVLKRQQPLDNDLRVSALIGPAGGTLNIAKAGIHVRVPPGAVDAPTHITMTALAGSDVAYEFAPHGITFNVPLRVTQDLHGTAAEHDLVLAARLQGSYYDHALAAAHVGTSGAYVRIQESCPGKTNPVSKKLHFSIGHFSGYLISTGRSIGQVLDQF